MQHRAVRTGDSQSSPDLIPGCIRTLEPFENALRLQLRKRSAFDCVRNEALHEISRRYLFFFLRSGSAHQLRTAFRQRVKRQFAESPPRQPLDSAVDFVPGNLQHPELE